MIGYILLAVMVSLLTVLAYFLLPLSVFTIGGLGAAISIMGFIVIKIFNKKIYPLKVRVWEERYGDLIISKEIRAKRVKNEVYQTAGGKKFPAPDRKYIVYGNDNYLDVVKKGEEFFPMIYDRNTEKLIPVPESHRRWLANQIVKDIKASEPKLSMVGELIKVGVPILLCFILFMSLLFVPDFLVKSQQIYDKFIGTLESREQQLTEYAKQGVIRCECNCPTTAPAQTNPQPPPG